MCIPSNKAGSGVGVDDLADGVDGLGDYCLASRSIFSTRNSSALFSVATSTSAGSPSQCFFSLRTRWATLTAIYTVPAGWPSCSCGPAEPETATADSAPVSRQTPSTIAVTASLLITGPGATPRRSCFTGSGS